MREKRRSPVPEMTDPVARPATHGLLDRIFGRHDWVLTDGFYYFRNGGDGMFRYECRCGALREAYWPGEHAAGRRLTDEEKKALGPYL